MYVYCFFTLKEVVLIKKYFIALIMLSFSFIISSCDVTPVSSDMFVMDTVMTQTVYSKNAKDIINETESIIRNLENTYSSYEENSLTDKINKNAGISPVKVTKEEFDIIKRCVEFSDKTDGIFDLTIAPLTKLWNITGENPTVPEPDKITKALALINYKNVVLDEENLTVFLKENGTALDFGATVKGFAVQQILECFQQNNVIGAVVSLGGNVAVCGNKNGTPFKVGLRDPQKGSSDYFAILEGENKIISTSGGYERYFEENGIIYHHILNPKTGYPCESDLLSVSVISEDGLLSDFLSTYFYMAGTDEVKNHLNEEKYSLIAIDKENKVYISPSLEGKITLLYESGYTLA